MSGPVDLGQTYRYRYTVKDAVGVSANAGTVVVTITLPDGTTATPSISNLTTGVYDISYTTTQAGLHNISGSATGGVLSAEFDKWEDAFTVETPLRTFIGLDEASAHLRATTAITADIDREQLRWLCMVACDAVERDLGRTIARKTVTEVYDGGEVLIVLRQSPVISITSVTDSTVALTAADYTLDATAGLLYRGSTSSYWTRFTTGRKSVSVTYIAGYTDPPRIARMVALNIVQNAWQQSQQASHPLIDESAAGEVFAAVASLPSSIQRAYDSLRAPAVA